jgi:flavin reductase (DIM6/NTAB) family NADH-FMN oxidoreductase RutF
LLDELLTGKYDEFRMENQSVMTLDPESLRAAMRAWSAGVTVVTATYENQKHGMTVNSFTSISLDPALITISLQQNTRTHEVVLKSKAFGLTILSAEQVHLSNIFAGRFKEIEDKFANIKTETLVTGSPFIMGGLSWLDCRIVQTFDAGMNTLFISEVVAARGTGSGEPLIYHNREYWTLQKLP